MSPKPPALHQKVDHQFKFTLDVLHPASTEQQIFWTLGIRTEALFTRCPASAAENHGTRPLFLPPKPLY